MPTDPGTIEHLRDIARLGPRLTTRRMFGEYALYVDGKVLAFVCDNSLFVKYTAQTGALTAALPAGQAYPGSKPYAVADALLDEPEQLQQLLLATADALPLPPPVKPRRPKGSAGKRAPKAG